MTFRLAQPPEAIAEAVRLRPALRPAKVAALLDVDRSEVYKLVRARELEAHRHGTRGLRIYVDSLEAYRERMRRGAPGARAGTPRPPDLGASYHEACAFLRSRRVL